MQETHTRILVVDDHPFFREGLNAWISRQPGFVLCGDADSPTTAQAQNALHKPHAVLLDIQLREGDGLEFLRSLKQAEHRPQVIVLSHKDAAVFAERALEAGARGYVLKDEAMDVLHDAIRAVMCGGIFLSEAVRRHMQVEAGTLRDRIRTLYNRELQVLELLGRGRTTKEIALAGC